MPTPCRWPSTRAGPDDLILVTGSLYVVGRGARRPGRRRSPAASGRSSAQAGRAHGAGRHATLLALVNRTLVICKPDAVERGLTGEIIGRLERKGLRLVAAELRTIDRETAARHYAEHEGKAFYEDLLAFITRSPVMLLVVEGPEDTWQIVRTMMGATNPAAAAPGRSGATWPSRPPRTWCTAPTAPSRPQREIALFFPDAGRAALAT